MQILRDPTHTLIPVFYRRENKDKLAVTLMAMFSFSQPKVFLSFQEFWTIVKKNFSDNEMLDFYLPKLRAEYFVKGSCFAYNPETRRSEVEVILDSFEKKLLIFGDRYWIINGLVKQASQPAVFQTIPLSYENAFGGEGNIYNPRGKGDSSSPNAEKSNELPNIEMPDKQLLDKTDKPLPALLLPYSPDSKINNSKLGTFDRDWYENDRPFYPKNIDWTYFNRALPDQQREGYFKGNESFMIKNMHPGKKLLTGNLPGMRIRCFYQYQNPEAKLEEISLNLDTVWFIPEFEKGILIWHGQIDLIQGKKPSFLHSVHEALDEPKKTPDFYFSRLKNPAIELPVHASPPKEIRPPQPGIADELGEQLKKIRIQKEEDPETTKLRVQLNTLLSGLSPGAKMTAAKAFSSQIPKDSTLNKAQPSPHATRQLFEYISKYKEEIANGNHSSKEKQQLLDEAVILEKRLSMLDSTGKMAQYRLETASPSMYTRDDVIRAYQEKTDLKYENLAGIDLSDLDLSGIDLTGCNLSHCLLVNTKLNKANLGQVTLIGTRLDKSALLEANLTSAYIKDSLFCNVEGRLANFSKAELADCKLENCNFPQANFYYAKISESSFEQCKLTRLNAEGLIMTESSLKSSDLNQSILKYSHLERCIFDHIELSEADWSYTDCRHSQFKGISINRLKAKLTVIRHCNLTNCLFDYCELTSSELTNSHFEKSRFLHCNLEKATFAGTTIINSRIAHSNMKNWRTNADTIVSKTKFINTDLKESALLGGNFDNISWLACSMEAMQVTDNIWVNSELTQCNARKLRVSGSEMKRVDFKKTNLLQATFDQSRFIESEFSHSNLFGTTFNSCTLIDTQKLNCLEQQSYFDKKEG
ncbi:DUF2169 family type VI secretion system accessory protein [Legionella quinlivanii]|uniref:DUF2169 family type VI secretion system accessory protein n=1 Tax=Legionella quinlivanii TaxID=45073 RepID=UPI0022442FD5|nr:DUF2169 domain-containing protein [Legionella quinlivanii]MCW8450013.1 DUF2169 domain-containing protein [Legionella quinlivanii]